MIRADPTTHLCESCGYPIGELPRGGNCPECGRAIAKSLPERRVGTPWQQKRGVGSWARTVAMVARRPRRVWDVVRVEAPASGDLLTLHCALAVFGVCASIAAWMLFVSGVVDWPLTITAGIAVAVGGTVMLLVLSMIEYAGIRFFGARRKWRVSHEVAMSVVGHASAGWLLLPLTLPLFWWIAASGFAEALNGATGLGWLGTIVTIVAALAGPLIPLLAFELLVYDGMRRMRFANVALASDPLGSSPLSGAGT